MKPGARPELEVQLARLTAAGTLWWVFIGVAGAVHAANALELWQKAPGLAAMLWAVSGIAIFVRASREYREQPATGPVAPTEPHLAGLAADAIPGPDLKVA